MTEVIIAGIGQLPVGEHWETSLRSLGVKAIRAALKDSGGLVPQALYIGNLLAPVVSNQSNLGALLTDYAGLNGIEAYTVEAAEASGAGAVRMGYNAIASGYVDVAIVLGVEKYTDRVGPTLTSAVAQITDYDYEALNGMTPASTAGLLMQRYLHEYHVTREVFAGFPILAHANAMNNPNAFNRRPITEKTYASGGMVSDPLSQWDIAPYADGAAALVLTRGDLLPSNFPHPHVRLTASSIVVDTLSLHDRSRPLAFDAAGFSVERACRMSGILPSDVDFFELCDAYSIYAVLSLEAAGFARRGEGWKLAQDGSLALNGKLPISTMGGWKARGNPLGASGVYQVVEAVLQLRGQAGANQVKNARRALVQTLGGPAATAVTHVLETI